jgi:hypothetical protein
MTNDHPPDRHQEPADERSDTVDPAVLAASAYLDGEASDVERQLVEGDPAVRRLSEQFGEVSQQLNDVEPAGTTAVDSVLAAALTAFDQADFDQVDEVVRSTPSRTAVITTTPPLRSRTGSATRSGVPPRSTTPRFARVLKLAAAVLVIGALGAVASTTLRSGSQQDSVAQLSDAAPSDARLQGSQDDVSADEFGAESAEDADLPMAATEAAPAGADEDMAADDGAGMETFGAPDHSDDSDVASDWSDTDLMVFDGPDQLARFARSMIDADALDSSHQTWSDTIVSDCLETPTASTPIISSSILGPALYIGSRAVIVVLESDQDSYVQAIDPVTCGVLAEVPL